MIYVLLVILLCGGVWIGVNLLGLMLGGAIVTIHSSQWARFWADHDKRVG